MMIGWERQETFLTCLLGNASVADRWKGSSWPNSLAKFSTIMGLFIVLSSLSLLLCSYFPYLFPESFPDRLGEHLSQSSQDRA